jgi:hypothetical protein
MPVRFPMRPWGRRSVLLLPLLFAACGGPPPSYPPLQYAYLPPIRLNVAQVEVRQQFLPSGLPPDISQDDPVQPVEVLRQTLQDRLKAFGSAGRAVAVIEDASLVEQDDTITGSLAVRLNIYTSANTPAGFAAARVSRQHVGHIGDLRETLYDMTKQMMDAMNVELEYQIRRSLRDWLVPEGGAPTAVQQQPLATPGIAPAITQTPPPSLTPPPSVTPRPPAHHAPAAPPPPPPMTSTPDYLPSPGPAAVPPPAPPTQ